MSNHKPPALFISGSPGLDFLNTVAYPLGERVDWLDDGDGLLSWVEQAGLVPEAVLKALRARAMPGEFDGVAARARDLRERVRGFVMARRGRSLGVDDLRELGPLNRLLDRDERFDQIVAEAAGEISSLQLKTLRRWRSPESLLLPIGEELAKSLCGDGFQHVKVCEDPTCALLFEDRTRGRVRRWCSMALCGNRAKQAAHRNRRKSGD